MNQLQLGIAGEGFFGVQDANGEFYLTRDGSLVVQGEQVGTVPLFLPDNPQQLQPVGENNYIMLEGEAAVFNGGSIQQQIIELSNVDLAQELTNMMLTQRAYSLNAKAAQTADEWMTMINQFNH